MPLMARIVWEAMAMVNERAGEVRIDSESDIVTARKIVRNTAIAMGFSVTDVTRIVTAASELTRNVFRYAGSGVMRWRIVDAGEMVGLELTFEDRGPGIPDIERAMEAGYTTKGGLGLGLPGAKRLMDDMEIESEVGKGTRVTVKKWRK
jgi:serine/threonine-protein kinase RsbT